jgi:hypothetical protein
MERFYVSLKERDGQAALRRARRTECDNREHGKKNGNCSAHRDLKSYIGYSRYMLQCLPIQYVLE